MPQCGHQTARGDSSKEQYSTICRCSATFPGSRGPVACGPGCDRWPLDPEPASADSGTLLICHLQHPLDSRIAQQGLGGR